MNRPKILINISSSPEAPLTSERFWLGVCYGIITMLVLALFAGCSTVAPQPVEPAHAYEDSSTPRQYNDWNSGVIGYFTSKDGRTWYVLTSDKFARFLADHAGSTAGIQAFTDTFGNALHAISQQALGDWHKQVIDK